MAKLDWKMDLYFNYKNLNANIYLEMLFKFKICIHIKSVFWISIYKKWKSKILILSCTVHTEIKSSSVEFINLDLIYKS